MSNYYGPSKASGYGKNYYGSPASSTKGYYGSASSTATGKKKKKGKSIGGFLGNIAHGVEDVTVGSVVGGYMAGKAFAQDIKQDVDVIRGKKGKAGQRTVKIVKAIGKSYADTYGPLVHGDVDTFLDNVYNNPVGIALDAATVASLGLGAAVKVGVLPAKGGKVLELTDAAGKVTRTKVLAKGEMRARLQAAALQARNKKIALPENRLVLEKARGKVIRPEGKVVAQHQATVARRAARNKLAPMARFNPALEKLSPNERLAVSLRGQYDRPALNAEIARLKAVAKEQGPKGPAAQQLKAITNRGVQKLFDKPSKAMDEFHPIAKEVGEAQKAILNIAPDVAENRRYLPARIAHGAVRDKETGEWIGGPSIEELKARGLDPIYYPDVAELPKRPTVIEGQGGGLGVPQRTGNTRVNEGVLRGIGQIVNDPATLGQSFAKSVKYSHYVDVHDRLLGMASEASYIPDGYVAIRARRAEKIPHTKKTRAEFQDWSAEHLDDAGELTQDALLTTRSPNEAMRTKAGNLLVVPKSVAKDLTGEFRKTGAFTRMLQSGPMRVWRALTLGLTPRWLVNNVVGNTLMYMMRSGSRADVEKLAGAIRQAIHPRDYKEFDRLLDKHFAGQTRGGFTATQYPPLKPKTKVGKVGSKITGFLPAGDRRWDQALRSAKVQAELKKHPRLREVSKQMGRETSEFERVQKLDEALTQNPEIANEIYDKVNDALGSYDHLTGFEKNVLRNLFPFYAWYKAISGVALKYTLDHPLAVNVLSNLANVGIEAELAKAGIDPNDVPLSLRGLIPIGIDPDGRVRGINTAGANPYATVGQLADFVEALATLQPGEVGRKAPGLNPFLGALMELYVGTTPMGYDVNSFSVVEGLPQTRLLKAAEAQGGPDIPFLGPAATKNPMYDHDIRDELLRYLGLPYVRVSKSAAKKVAEK